VTGAGQPCGGAAEAPPAVPVFNTQCARGHGADGTGNRPDSTNADPKARNCTGPAWQASGTDDQLKDTLLNGGAGVGKSPMMTGQPQLKDHPEVLDGLVQIIRKFGKHP